MADPAPIATMLIAAWQRSTRPPPGEAASVCRTIAIDRRHPEPCRFAFFSLLSPIERLLTTDLSDAGSGPLTHDELGGRLVDGETVLLLTGTTPPEPAPVPPAIHAARVDARRRAADVRHGLITLGLQEIASPRGADVETIDAVADLWDLRMSLAIDVATELSLGADRQRYVDPDYTARAHHRLPGLQQRLEQAGVWSNPILTLP